MQKVNRKWSRNIFGSVINWNLRPHATNVVIWVWPRGENSVPPFRTQERGLSCLCRRFSCPCCRSMLGSDIQRPRNWPQSECSRGRFGCRRILVLTWMWRGIQAASPHIISYWCTNYWSSPSIERGRCLLLPQVLRRCIQVHHRSMPMCPSPYYYVERQETCRTQSREMETRRWRRRGETVDAS